MFPHCFKIPPKYIVLFKGDDSDFDGNQEVAIDIGTELPLEGMKAHFRFLDFSQDFDSIPEDRRLLLVFPREKTMKFPLGAMDAALTFEDSQGRIRTIANRIHIVVTNSVEEAYWNKETQAITVVMSGDEYLKNAEVSEDGKTLTITKKDGTEVQFRGGGGGGGAVDSVNGETGDVVLTADKINIDPDSEFSTKDAIQALLGLNAETVENLNGHTNNRDNPHQVTAGQVGTYTSQEIDDKITRFVAHYLTTKNAEGRFVPFATHAALAYAKTHHTDENPQFFYAGQSFTPTKNDYCVVLADETYGGKTTRYSFVGDWPDGQFQYQYTINDTAFSQAQWDAINSGVTENLLGVFDRRIDANYQSILGLVGQINTVGEFVNQVDTKVDTKADKLADTIVAKIDEDRHDDNIMIRIMRVPIEFARKAFNAVRVSFHQNDEDQYVYMGIGYSTGDGGSSGLMYTDTLVEYSSDSFYKNESGNHIYRFSQNVTSQIPSDAKFLTFFFYHDSVEGIEGTAPIETGYATTEEEQQKKYQIQQSAGFFFVDHAPLIDFLMVNDPVARESGIDAVKSKVDDIKATVSTDNRFLVGGTTAAIQTRTDDTSEWTNEIRVDKGYDALQGSTMVKLDKSVQTVTVAGGTLTVELPDAVEGTVRDLCLYVNNNSGADCALVFPAGTYYGDNPNVAVAKDGGVTAVYITEMPVGSWMLRISELEQFTVGATA